MILYKLTNKDSYTKNNTHWEVGKTISLPPTENPQLCSVDVLHAYTSPLLAELMDTAHGNFEYTKRLFKVEGEIEVSDGTKVGSFSLTVLEECTNELPVLTQTQRIAFGILCSLEVYRAESYVVWVENWLSGKDRSNAAASAADAAAADAAAADAYAAAYAAASADAAAASADAAAAASADAAAADTNKKINFESLAQKALTFK